MLHSPEYRSKWMDNYANPPPKWTGEEESNILKYKKKKSLWNIPALKRA
jgi:hypothetical protein